MSIFILEDDLIQAQSLKQQIEQYCTEQQIPYDFLEATSKPNEILSKIAHCTYVPIYFLDIEIKNDERRGLDVAKEIRKIDSQGIIVFITTHAELAPISYQYMVSALTFIDKSTRFEQKKSVIERCLQQYAAKNQLPVHEDFLLVENPYTTIKVPFSSVEYIMTDEPHRLKLITTEQLIQFYGTLKELEQLDSRLVRCHKSYIVNKQQIRALNQQQLILQSGKAVPVSRRMIKLIKTLLKEC